MDVFHAFYPDAAVECREEPRSPPFEKMKHHAVKIKIAGFKVIIYAMVLVTFSYSDAPESAFFRYI